MNEKTPDNEKAKALPSGLSESESQHFIREFEQLEKEFQEMDTSIQPLMEKRWLELGGPHLKVMLHSPNETTTFLRNPEPQLRQLCIELCYSHWNLTQSLVSEYERIALDDPDSGVRSAAVRALGSCYRRTQDQRIGHLLATIAQDDTVVDDLRLTAFASLLRLHGNMEYTGSSPLVPQSLDEVDWAFVDQYRHGWAPAKERD
jgi:hypothetical protein